jgi:hypothetical protein
MKKIILPSLALAAILSASVSNAQSNRAYAITSETKGSFNWNFVREVDLTTGEVTRNIYDPSSSIQIFDAITKAPINVSAAERYSMKALPMVTGVAAAAYDDRTERLYFTNMRGDELRYFDMATNQTSVFFVRGMGMAGGNKFDEANVITRMAFASDGFGYALTNDGKSLIRFTADQKPTIVNLGELIDGKKNGTLSVHSQCSSWGGDMVGDAYGNLYLITMRNNVFKINPETRIADFQGQVKGLPADFTTNGIAVNDEGELVLSSANFTASYYKVNPATFNAVEIKKNGDNLYNASDLANSNLLYAESRKSKDAIKAQVIGNSLLSVYPNPVANKMFTMQFDKVPAGQYNLSLADVSGRLVFVKSINIAGAGQVEKISLPRSTAGGMYLIKLSGSDSKAVYSDKIVVQ